MLEQHDVPFRYREYTRQPLTEDEIRRVLDRLDLEPRGLLRTRDRAFKKLGLTGDEPADRLIGLMAKHPTLIQRPIGISGDRGVVGRPPEKLLGLSR